MNPPSFASTCASNSDGRLACRYQRSGSLAEEWDLSLVGDWDEFTENMTTQ